MTHAGYQAGDVPRGAHLRVEQAARSLAMVLLWAEARRTGPVNTHAREVRPVTRELERWQAALDRQLVALGSAAPADDKERGLFGKWLEGQGRNR